MAIATGDGMNELTLSQLFSLEGRSALVTGAAKGIGAAIASRLAEAGASVAIADVDEAHANDVAAKIRARGHKALAIGCDISRVADAARIVERTRDAFGSIDVLVNNAGIFPMMDVLHLDEATWDRVQGINLRGAFFTAQAAARHMVKAGRGSIVNIASVDAFHPSGALAHYDASKGGLVMLTRSLAFELGRSGIRVNAIAPGAIATPGTGMVEGAKATPEVEAAIAPFLKRVPLGRMGLPDDIARAALFLATAASDYVTGSVLVVDGGYLVS